MAGYTPVFDTVFDGTLCGKWPALPVWLTILPLADWRGHIDITPQAIVARTGWPIELLMQGIEELMRPDPQSRSRDEDGRRLALIDPNRSWGWRVVNIQKYRSKASGQDQIADGRNAEKVRRYKERHRKTPADTTDTHSDSYTNTYSNSEKSKTHAKRASVEPPEFAEIREAYPSRAGGQRWGDALKFYLRNRDNGVTHDVMLDGVRRYKRFLQATGEEGQKTVQQAATFLGDNKGYLELWHPPPPKQRELSPVERVMAANGVRQSDERVVSEQFSGSDSSLGNIFGDVRDSPHAGLRRIGS